MFVARRNKIITAIIATIISSLLFLLFEYKIFHYATNLIFSRIIIYSAIYIFILINIIFDYKKIWSFVFKNRYLIGLIIFILLVTLGIHTSSLSVYADLIQPNLTSQEQLPIWGTYQTIRSDEFIANTPTVLSQKIEGLFNDTSSYIMAANGSVLMFPKVTTWNISVLTNPSLLGFFILDIERGFSFYSLIQYFIAFFGVLELLLIITKNNKPLSVSGTIIIVFAPVILWWDCCNQLAYGSICLVFFYHIITEKKVYKKLLYSFILGWSFACMVAIIYPAWLVPFGYLYLAIAIWMIYDERKDLKILNFLYLSISLIIAMFLLVPEFIGSKDILNAIANSSYPGSREDYGGSNWEILYQWFTSPFYSISNVGNPCEFSSFVSLYPVPIIIGIYFIIKNIKSKKFDLLLIILVSTAILLNIWNFIPIGWFAKITLLNKSTTTRAAVVVAFACVLLIIHLVNNYSNKNIKITNIIMGLVCVIVIIPLAYYATSKYEPSYLNNNLKIIIAASTAAALIFLFLINSRKTNVAFLSVMVAISLFSLATIHPLTVGLDAIYNKPVSKKISEISKEDVQSTWISANAPDHFSNYALANGAKVLNSVNFYPQICVWEKLDPSHNYYDIYNRFAHIGFNITDNETTFDLTSPDAFTVNININDLWKLDIKYIYSNDQNLSKFSNENVTLSIIYSEDGSSIYRINYSDYL